MARKRRKIFNFKSEKGYLMLSTLFLLILSGIMTQSIIKISNNQLIQLHQLSKSYQEKTALNLAENILSEALVNEEERGIEKASLRSSVGDIEIKKIADNKYQLLLKNKNTKSAKKIIDFNFEENQLVEKEKIKSSE